MSKLERFHDLQQEENDGRWEWQGVGDRRIAAVPLEGEESLAEEMGVVSRNKMMVTFMGLTMGLTILAMIAAMFGIELLIALNVHPFTLAFPLVALDAGIFIPLVVKVANIYNHFDPNEQYLYTINLPWSRDTDITQRRERTNQLAQYLNHRQAQVSEKISTNDDPSVSNWEAAFDDYYLYVNNLSMENKATAKRLLSSRRNREDIRIALESREKQDSTSSAKHLPQIKKIRQLSNPMPAIAVPETATRATKVQAFYDHLAIQRHDMKHLPLAAKRWNSLQQSDRENLVLIMEELTPALEMEQEAKELGRYEFLRTVETQLEENISLAEAEAERMNTALDKANMNAITSSGIFLREKFPQRDAEETELNINDLIGGRDPQAR